MVRYAGHDKVPKHASIACRQLADFVGRKTGKRKLEKKFEIIYKKQKCYRFVYTFKRILLIFNNK